MQNSAVGTVVLLLIASVVVADAAATQSRAWIDYREYITMADPREASVKILSDAQRKGVDIDKRSEQTWSGTGSPVGSRGPTEGSDAFLQGLVDADPEDRFVIVVATRHFLSVRDVASILGLGIRILKIYNTSWAMIARGSGAAILELSRLPQIEWVAPLLPEHKYNPDSPLVPREQVHLTIMVAPHDSCEARLRAFGATSVVWREFGGFYLVRIPQPRLHELAELWWVRRIIRTGAKVFH